MRRLAAAALLAAWCFVSWKLSSQSDPEAYVGVHLHLNDKIEHMIEYGTAGLLAACAAWSPGRRLPPLVAAIVFCGLWGTSDEVHQSFVAGRDCSQLDLLADIAGGTLGGLAFLQVSGRLRPRAAETMNPSEATEARRRT